MSRLEQIKSFLKDSPEDAFLNYALATEYVSAEDDGKAEEQFRKLLSLHPNYVAIYYHYGKLLERKKQKDEAMNMYRKGIAVAKEIKGQHSLAELQSALLELEYED